MNKNDEGLKWYEIRAGKKILARRKHRKDNKQGTDKSSDVKASRDVKTPGDVKKSSDVKTQKKISDKNTGVKKSRPRKISSITEIDYLLDGASIPDDAKKILSEFKDIIEATHPLNSKQRAQLPQNILELSHTLTDERGQRRLGYMNHPATLAAYTHYFLWWNLVRLTRLFANLPADFFSLPDGAICLDSGSGPLTVPIAIFLSRPELRDKKLKWYCMDISAQALSIGENLLLTTAARLEKESWQIVKVKGNFGTEIKEKADLVTSANVFNEISEDNDMPPDYLAKKYTDGLLSYAGKNDGTKILLIEPGVPKSARLLSLMRDSFMRKDYLPLSPCPHFGECPMDGKRGGKWCNFAFSVDEAPTALKKISESARLPKIRAVLSFIAAEKKSSAENENVEKNLTLRIASDPIRLPGHRTGFYACSELGLILVVTESNLRSGESIRVPMPRLPLESDEKSGAGIIYC